MEKNNYVFKNSFVFVESGVLRNDIYIAFKDELCYLLEDKYKLYMKEFCAGYEKILSDFYGDFAEILRKLTFIMQDSSVTNLRKYVDEYKNDFNKNLIKVSDTKKMYSALNILLDFDDAISKLCFEIILACKENNLNIKRGVFSIINQYFNLECKKNFNSVTEFLDSCYGSVYETMRTNYIGKKYGGKL